MQEGERTGEMKGRRGKWIGGNIEPSLLRNPTYTLIIRTPTKLISSRGATLGQGGGHVPTDSLVATYSTAS